MASNNGPGGFPDPVDGRDQDWFELYNPNSAAVNLSGFYLTDTLSQPTKWQIPTNTALAGHGFLLVWADGETNQNGLSPNRDLHAAFQLNNNGEAIGLFSPEGTLQHAVVFGPQFKNVSQGLFPDGTTNAYYYMTNWTPRASNKLGMPPTPALANFILGTNGSVSFSFSTIPGRTYGVEYKDDLATPDWLQLGTLQFATGSSFSVSDELPDSAQRFYRVVLVP
jgi:hypothetical protein